MIPAMERDQVMEVGTAKGMEPIHVLRSGKGARRFLIWHGFDAVNRFYPWNYLENHGEVIRVGLPGHGPVPPKEWADYKLWDQAHFIEIAVAVCRRFQSTEPLVLIGHSAGAIPALGAAMTLGSAIGGLVLVNPLLWAPYGGLADMVSKTGLWPRVGTFFLEPRLKRKQKSVDAFLAEIRPIIGDRKSFYSNPNTYSHISEGHRDYQRMQLPGLLGAARVLMSHDMRPLVVTGKPEVPALIVHGSEDRVAPIAQSEWLMRNMSNAAMANLRGVGHIGHGEREDEFIGLVTRWLSSRKLAG